MHLTERPPATSAAGQQGPEARALSRRHAAARAAGLSLAILIVALVQSHSVWSFDGQRADESELVHFAVGFFGGDLDPGWYGYGSLGMYLLSAVYWVLGMAGLLVGRFASLQDYATQLFTSGYFIVVGRVVFAVVSVSTVLIYARVARDLGIPRWLVAAFAVVALTSRDAITFANYVRSDTLVAFFVALSLLAFVRSQRRPYLLLLGVATAGAIASKLSALPLIAFLLGTVLWRWRRGDAGRRTVVAAIVVFAVALFLFQPFFDYPEQLARRATQSSEGFFNWGKTYYTSIGARIGAIGAVLFRFVTAPVLLLSAGVVTAFRRTAPPLLRMTVVGALILLSVLVAPFSRSPEISDYWFVPVFNLLRFLALVGVAGCLAVVKDRSKAARTAVDADRRTWPQAVPAAIAAALVVALAWPGLSSWARTVTAAVQSPGGNRQLAQAWLEDSVYGEVPIVMDAQYPHMLPRVYDPQDVEMSKTLSRAFIYDRRDHPYLNRIFEAYLTTEYVERVRDRDGSLGRLPPVRRMTPFDLAAQRHDEPTAEAYFVTSPTIYNRFVGRDASTVPPDRVAHLRRTQAFYGAVTSSRLAREFTSGTGAPIEVYAIDVPIRWWKQADS